jgi:hypothetical protein
VTRETFAAWQEAHFDKHAEPVSEGDRNVRRIELTLPFFLFSRSDANFSDGADYVTIKDVRRFWDPQNPDFPEDFEQIKGALTFRSLFAARADRQKLAGLPESAQNAVVGTGATSSAARNIQRAIIDD